mgnify:CR=1 FL=1
MTMAITGLHTLLYSSEVDAFRAVMRDAFELPHQDDGGGWMVFDCPPATMEPHPGPPEIDVQPGDRPTHQLGFVCDDIDATIEELRAKGVEFRGEPIDMGWGVAIVMVLPGGVEMVLEEPRD